MTQTALPAGRRMALVDGLRAVAALTVVLPHAWLLFRDAIARPGWLSDAVYLLRVQGTLGVQVFFVLSGFVIAYSLRDARVTLGFFGRFVLRRSIRLDPAYWASLVLCCGVLWIEGRFARDGAVLPTGRVFVIHLAYLQEVFHCRDAINHTYWTLCIEVQLYLAFCAAIGLLQWARLPYPPILTVAAAVALSWPLNFWAASPTGLFIPHAYGFLAGAVAWWAVDGAIPRWAAFGVIGGGATLAARHLDWPVFAVDATAALLAIAGFRGSLAHWLDVKPLQQLGRASYGLYLLHNPAIWLAVVVQVRTGWVSVPADFALLALVYAATVAGAWAMHVAIEKPCLRLGRRLGGRQPPAVAADAPLIPA